MHILLLIRPTKLKGPRKVTKKPSPKKEIVETEEVKEEVPIDLISGDIPSTQDVNMNREDIVVGDQQDLPTSMISYTYIYISENNSCLELDMKSLLMNKTDI